MNQFTYEDWLCGHATRKSMMEKLERSLIPYELFAQMPLCNDRRTIRGEASHGCNRYTYEVRYDYSRFGNDIYDVEIIAAELPDPWNDLLCGSNRFKLVMKSGEIVTIYSDHEDFFSRIIQMFDRNDWAELYKYRSNYVKNLLARYILLRLIEAHIPNMQLIASVETKDDGKIPVIAANANRTRIIMYTFNKHDAIVTADTLDGVCDNLTVVYFINQNFERDGNNKAYENVNTHVVSIRQFYGSLPIGSEEKQAVERQVLMLVSMLYNESLEWDYSKIQCIALNPPLQETLRQKMKSQKKSKATKIQNAWYYRIYRTLLEDALNVLQDTPCKHADIFHFLCASTMVNAYVNFCNRYGRCSVRQMQRMFQAKQQMAAGIEYLASTCNPNLKITLGEKDNAVLCNMRIGKKEYQFSYRGFDADTMERLRSLHLPKGRYSGYSMQSIATALYQYSYLRRWKSLTPTSDY